MPHLRRAVAAQDPAARPLPLRLLPDPLSADGLLPVLRRALDHHANEQRGPPLVRAMRRVDAQGPIAAPSREREPLLGAAELIRSRRVEPSILSADYAQLADQLAIVLDAGARVIHVDV